MKAKKIYDGIIFESPIRCNRDKYCKGNSHNFDNCAQITKFMKDYYVEDGIYRINGEMFYSIWAYKLKFTEKFKFILDSIAKTLLKGRRPNYITYEFLFTSRHISHVDTNVILENLDIPYSICKRDLYKNYPSEMSLRYIFKLEDLDIFFDSYNKWVFNNLDQYIEGAKQYDSKIKIER